MQDDILKLAYEVSNVTATKIHLIDSVTSQARFLAINAHIEAARAGAAGAGFGMLADEMRKIADRIMNVSAELRVAVEESAGRLQGAGAALLRGHKGARHTDLALNAVELIDRNLYERSCDVRWWATDSAVVAALEVGDEAARAEACARLGTILQSYTVYLDLMIADASGRIVACGRPRRHGRLLGLEARRADWFIRAMRTKTGEDYVVADVRSVRALEHAQAAIYATAIRAGGAAEGRVLGVLGIAFDWAPQAAAIVNGVRLGEEAGQVRVMLLDAKHRVLAASDGAGLLTETYPLRADRPRGHYCADGKLIAYALTPGYETYRGLGWYGVIEANL